MPGSSPGMTTWRLGWIDKMISEPLRNPLSLFDVSGKVAIITGASGTFGRAAALALSALGGKVLLASGSKAELEAVADEVREVGGEPATIVRRPETLDDAQAMLDAALVKFGRADQLVVASGVNKPGFIHEQPLEEWESVMDANVRGIWLMAKAVGTHWITNKVRGKVVVMSSVRGATATIPATPVTARQKAQPTPSPACWRPSGPSTASR